MSDYLYHLPYNFIPTELYAMALNTVERTMSTDMLNSKFNIQ